MILIFCCYIINKINIKLNRIILAYKQWVNILDNLLY
jgi:hypothetical protein